MNADSTVDGFALTQASQERPGQVHEIPPVAHNPEGQWLDSQVLPPRSPYTVQAGVMIPVELQQAINSDLHGAASATVTQDVYDSIRGQSLLIPRTSRLFLEYNAARQETETRLQLAAKTLYFPDGSSLSLGGMPSLDDEGAAGVKGRINRHLFQRYGTAALLSLITGGISLAIHRRGGYSHYEPSDAGLYGVGSVMGRAVGEDLYRGMNARPTLTIPTGYRFHLQFAQDYAFPAPYPFHHATTTQRKEK